MLVPAALLPAARNGGLSKQAATLELHMLAGLAG